MLPCSVWVSPLFPKLDGEGSSASVAAQSDSTNFKQDLLVSHVLGNSCVVFI